MATDFNNLRVLQAAEKMADEVWKLISIWEEFALQAGGLLADDQIKWLASVTEAAINLEPPILQSQI
ncbi:MAG TPA: hypothetical protein VGK81_10585 [Anaerolineae bacterium]|jgi:hypothetical protein